MWENTAPGPGAKLPHILCAGIGPLQLGVVVVSYGFIGQQGTAVTQEVLF